MRYEQAHSFIHSFIRSFQVVCPASPPPLFFLLGIMGNDTTTTTTTTTTPHFSLTHTHIYTMCGTKYPIPSFPPPSFPPTNTFSVYFSHTNRNDNYARARLASPPHRQVHAVLVLTCRIRYFAGSVGRSVGRSFGRRGRMGMFLLFSLGRERVKVTQP